jgi:PleD family two-component response regulator
VGRSYNASEERLNSHERSYLKIRKQILIVDDEIFNIAAIHVVLECRFDMKYVDMIC